MICGRSGTKCDIRPEPVIPTELEESPIFAACRRFPGIPLAQAQALPSISQLP